MPFPTIRNCLCSAQICGLLSRAKIQETVFELLTEQYELAKVEEAKETPSVKVLDPGKDSREEIVSSTLTDGLVGHIFRGHCFDGHLDAWNE